jgi:hypothetical protein
VASDCFAPLRKFSQAAAPEQRQLDFGKEHIQNVHMTFRLAGG